MEVPSNSLHFLDGKRESKVISWGKASGEGVKEHICHVGEWQSGQTGQLSCTCRACLSLVVMSLQCIRAEWQEWMSEWTISPKTSTNQNLHKRKFGSPSFSLHNKWQQCWGQGVTGHWKQAPFQWTSGTTLPVVSTPLNICSQGNIQIQHHFHLRAVRVHQEHRH